MYLFSILIKLRWGRQIFTAVSSCELDCGSLSAWPLQSWGSVGVLHGHTEMLMYTTVFVRMVSVTWDSSLSYLFMKWASWYSIITSLSHLWPKNSVWKPWLLALNVVLGVCGILVIWLSPCLCLEKGKVKFFLVICVCSSSASLILFCFGKSTSTECEGHNFVINHEAFRCVHLRWFSVLEHWTQIAGKVQNFFY